MIYLCVIFTFLFCVSSDLLSMASDNNSLGNNEEKWCCTLFCSPSSWEESIDMPSTIIGGDLNDSHAAYDEVRLQNIHVLKNLVIITKNYAGSVTLQNVTVSPCSILHIYAAHCEIINSDISQCTCYSPLQNVSVRFTIKDSTVTHLRAGGAELE